MLNVKLAMGNALVLNYQYGGDDMKYEKPAPAHHRREPFLLTQREVLPGWTGTTVNFLFTL